MLKHSVWLAILIVAVAGVATAATPLSSRRVSLRGWRPAGRRAPRTGASGYLWVSNFGDATIARVDPATNRVTGSDQGRRTAVRCRDRR